MNNRKPALLTLFLVVFIDLVGFGIVLPLLPIYSAAFHVTGFMLGLASSGYSLMQFLFAPFWGRLSDRVGRRPIILLSLAGSTASYVLFAYAQNFEVLVLSRLLAGVCGANLSVANAYVADITTRENRSKGMGVLGAAFGLGFLAGPLLSAWAVGWGPHGPGLLAAALCGLNLGWAIFLLPESLSRESRETASSDNASRGYFQDWVQVFRRAGVGRLIFIGFIFNLVITQWENCFGLFLQSQPLFSDHYLSNYLLLLSYVAIWVVLIQGGMIGRLTKRFGEPSLLKFGLALLAIALTWMAFVSTWPGLFSSLTLLAVAMSLIRPVMSGSISLLTDPAEQGLVLGVFFGVSGLARIFGPVAGGTLFAFGATLPFLAAGILSLLAWLLAQGLNRAMSRAPAVT